MVKNKPPKPFRVKKIKGRKRPKGYGRTTTTGLTKGAGLVRYGPNISLKRTKPVSYTHLTLPTTPYV